MVKIMEMENIALPTDIVIKKIGKIIDPMEKGNRNVILLMEQFIKKICQMDTILEKEYIAQPMNLFIKQINLKQNLVYYTYEILK